MEKRLFLTAVAIAVITGIAQTFVNEDLNNIVTLLVTGSGAWIGWKCAGGDSAKDFAMSAAFLWFLANPAWGDATASIHGVKWIGPQASSIFGTLVGLVVVIAAVGLLKNLMDRAQRAAG